MNFFSSEVKISKNEEIIHPILKNEGVSLFMKREDQLHDYVSGNKFRKLKYNVIEAKSRGIDTLLTFGGAYSNHIVATAVAGNLTNLQTIGVIRGEELGIDVSHTLAYNDTLKRASEAGMHLKFISRADYKKKTSITFLEQLNNEFGSFYVVPEGGTNDLAIKGCEEILSTGDEVFDYICCAVGTAGTISGIINASATHHNIIGFPALKGSFLSSEIEKHTHKKNWRTVEEYHFGGYAKMNLDLINFVNTFKEEQGIPLDPVYTGKMMYGLFDMIKKGMFTKNTRILAIHTGGLQGISGMNKKLRKKKLPLITI